MRYDSLLTVALLLLGGTQTVLCIKDVQQNAADKYMAATTIAYSENVTELFNKTAGEADFEMSGDTEQGRLWHKTLVGEYDSQEVEESTNNSSNLAGFIDADNSETIAEFGNTNHRTENNSHEITESDYNNSGSNDENSTNNEKNIELKYQSDTRKSGEDESRDYSNITQIFDDVEDEELPAINEDTPVHIKNKNHGNHIPQENRDEEIATRKVNPRYERNAIFDRRPQNQWIRVGEWTFFPGVQQRQ